MLRIDHLKDRAHILSEIKAHETQGEAGLHPTKRSNVEYRTLKHILRLIDEEKNSCEFRLKNMHSEYERLEKAMNESEKRHASLIWWSRLSLEEKFYKAIAWLKCKGINTTERHPYTLTGQEIQEVWENQKF